MTFGRVVDDYQCGRDQFSSSIMAALRVSYAINLLQQVIWLNGISIVLMILLFVILSANKILVNKVIYETRVRNVLIEKLKTSGAYVIEVQLHLRMEKNKCTVIRSPKNFSAQDVATIDETSSFIESLPVELRLRHVSFGDDKGWADI